MCGVPSALCHFVMPPKRFARLRASRDGGQPSRGVAKSTSRGSQSSASEGWWAHQDSNLERAGYEPAALAVELWARTSFKFQVSSLKSQVRSLNSQVGHETRTLET